VDPIRNEPASAAARTASNDVVSKMLDDAKVMDDLKGSNSNVQELLNLRQVIRNAKTIGDLDNLRQTLNRLSSKYLSRNEAQQYTSPITQEALNESANSIRNVLYDEMARRLPGVGDNGASLSQDAIRQLQQTHGAVIEADQMMKKTARGISSVASKEKAPPSALNFLSRIGYRATMGSPAHATAGVIEKLFSGSDVGLFNKRMRRALQGVKADQNARHNFPETTLSRGDYVRNPRGPQPAPGVPFAREAAPEPNLQLLPGDLHNLLPGQQSYDLSPENPARILQPVKHGPQLALPPARIQVRSGEPIAPKTNSVESVGVPEPNVVSPDGEVAQPTPPGLENKLAERGMGSYNDASAKRTIEQAGGKYLGSGSGLAYFNIDDQSTTLAVPDNAPVEVVQKAIQEASARSPKVSGTPVPQVSTAAPAEGTVPVPNVAPPEVKKSASTGSEAQQVASALQVAPSAETPKQAAEKPAAVRIHDSSTIGSHHGQTDNVIYATTGKEQRVQGKIDYSLYNGEVHINHIEVVPEMRRQGVARQMWEKLKADNPGMKINPGYATDEGAAFLQSVEGRKPETFKEALGGKSVAEDAPFTEWLQSQGYPKDYISKLSPQAVKEGVPDLLRKNFEATKFLQNVAELSGLSIDQLTAKGIARMVREEGVGKMTPEKFYGYIKDKLPSSSESPSPLVPGLPSVNQETVRSEIATKQKRTAKLPTGDSVSGNYGSPVSVKTPTGQLPGKYKVVEADSLIPSHNAGTFAKNPQYPEGVQERAYHTSKEAQARVIDQAQNYDPAYTINTNPDAVNGPPVVTPDGIVLGGNSRAMSTQRVYSSGKGDNYRNQLKSNAQQFGIDPAVIDGMKRPVLVREIAAPQTVEEARRIGSELNKSMTGALGVSEKAVTAGRSLKPETLQSVSAMLREGGVDSSLRDILRDRGKDIITLLQKDGVITDRERPQFVDTATGGLSEEGKSFAERALLGSVVDDPVLMDRTPKSVLNKISSSLGDISEVSGRADEYNILPLIRDALSEHADIAQRGTTIDLHLGQTGMFGPERNPAVDAIVRKLGDKPSAVRDALGVFAQDARADTQGQGFLMMGEKPTPTAAFNNAFGTNFTESEYIDAMLGVLKKIASTGQNGGTIGGRSGTETTTPTASQSLRDNSGQQASGSSPQSTAKPSKNEVAASDSVLPSFLPNVSKPPKKGGK
jgi:predicted GNAT family acetyltransferase